MEQVPLIPKPSQSKNPHGRYGLIQGNPCSNFKMNPLTPPDQAIHPEKYHIHPLNYPTKIPTASLDPPLPNTTHFKSPHGSYDPKQRNPCSNSKTTPPIPPDETFQTEKDYILPPKYPTNNSTANPDPPPPNTTHYESPHRSYSPKQGDPCPNTQNNPSTFPDEASQSYKVHTTCKNPP